MMKCKRCGLAHPAAYFCSFVLANEATEKQMRGKFVAIRATSKKG